MSLKECIQSCPLFAGTSAEDVELLLDVARERKHNRGELLFSQGEEAEGFFLVCEGRVKIYKLSPDGKERILHIVQPGQSFAEAAIFGDGLYPAFSEPLETTRLVFFPRQEFLELLHAHAQIAINMIGGLSRFLRQFAMQIEDLTFKDVPSRLARYLLDLADDAERVTLPITKTQLASRLGTVSETLSRTLRKLSDEEIISVQGKQIELLDYDRLIDLAEAYREG
ncbi:MAG: transcriptional regulator [Desulfuromonas sp.]|nr:MAG: transcriptional regulator [Desulfuromonas sp.]